MSERDDKRTSGEQARVLRCDQWEDMIADALDGTLPAADAAAFERHHGECALCAQLLKEAEQGRAWMEYLADEPEMPVDLHHKILARTSGLAHAGLDPAAGTVHGRGIAAPAGIPLPAAWRGVSVPHLRQVARQLFEPRLMMTIAMAFFSIALTLNLTGIRLTQIRASDLQPSRLRATLTRQYYSTNEQVTKYYENLRLVYEMEARVRELRRSSESEPVAAPVSPSGTSNQNPKQPERDGTATPGSNVPAKALPEAKGGHSHWKADPVVPTMVVDARRKGFNEVSGAVPSTMVVDARDKEVNEVFRAKLSTTEDQAEGSLV